MKYFFILLLFTGTLCAQDINKESNPIWFKAGPEKLPRYFKKGDVLPLCGIFEAIPMGTTKMQSCLQAKDDIEGAPPRLFEIVDLKDGNLNVIDRADKKSYSVKADIAATLWAKRFPEGEVMLPDFNLCNALYYWRNPGAENDDSFFKVTQLPFLTKARGEIIRYHVFEYHLGCGT